MTHEHKFYLCTECKHLVFSTSWINYTAIGNFGKKEWCRCVSCGYSLENRLKEKLPPLVQPLKFLDQKMCNLLYIELVNSTRK